MNRRELLETGLAALAGLPFMGWLIPKSRKQEVAEYRYTFEGFQNGLLFRIVDDGQIDAYYGKVPMNGLVWPMIGVEKGGYTTFYGVFGSCARVRLTNDKLLEIDYIQLLEPRQDKPLTWPRPLKNCEYNVFTDSFMQNPRPLLHGNTRQRT